MGIGKFMSTIGILFMIVIAIVAVYFAATAIGVVDKGLFKVDIGNAYHTQFDALSPEYLDVMKVNCASHSGTWKDQHDAIGCFDIEIPWDANICISTELDVMQSICGGLSGKWVCDTNKAGCYY